MNVILSENEVNLIIMAMEDYNEHSSLDDANSSKQFHFDCLLARLKNLSNCCSCPYWYKDSCIFAHKIVNGKEITCCKQLI